MLFPFIFYVAVKIGCPTSSPVESPDVFIYSCSWRQKKKIHILFCVIKSRDHESEQSLFGLFQTKSFNKKLDGKSTVYQFGEQNE